MAPERWERIKQVLEECLERPPEERPAYLDDACAGDLELRREVESLSASYEAAGDMMEEPALGREDSPADMEGRRVGPYRIVREIGEGGMACVYLAVRADDAFRRQVAIKLVKRGMDFDFILRRFRHERQIMASLEHPNIARLFDAGTCDDGVPYFVMEYIQGRPIDEHCDANRLTIPQRLELFCTVCSAVEHAHAHGIAHRDIKPGNILITPEGVPKLLDFGIAKVLNPEDWTGSSMTRTATVMRLMTPEYASPEQVRGEAVTASTDVYSLGVLLYQLLSGHRPYRLPSRAPHEMARAICEIEPERPSTAVGRVEAITRVPFDTPQMVTPDRVSATRGSRPDKLRRSLAGDLDNIVLMAMRKEPARRYATAADLAEDIRRFNSGRPVKARPDTIVYRVRKLAARHRTAVVACVAGGSLVLVLAAAALRWMPTRDDGLPAAPEVAPFTTFQGIEKQPVFSPDGRRIAFAWGGEKDENYDIYVKSLEGGELQRITTDPAEDASPAWSPDGRSIAWLRIKDDKVLRETGVFVAALAGGVHRKVADVSPNRVEAVGRHLDWSPDGRWLAVADKPAAGAPFAIYRIGVAGGAKQMLTGPPQGSIGDTSPAFSPDGKNISFLRSPSSGISELYVAPIGGGEVRRLTFDSRVVLSQTWAADGKSLIFSSNRTGGFYLWQVPAAGGTPRRMPGSGEGASEPSVTRDGRHIAYSQFRLDANIWQFDLVTRRPPRPLISSTQYDSSPQFSPDGTRVAFRSLRTGYNEIWVSGVDGSRPTQLTRFAGPLTGTPRWSPDGRSIAFDSRPEGQADIFVIPSGGGAPRRITSETSEDVVPNWSRDGKWLYFASNRGGTWEVWKTPLAGGPRVQVTHNGGFAPAESPDGRWLYYARGRGVAGLYRMPVEGGPEQPVLERLKPGFWGYWAASNEGVYFADLAKGVGGDLFYMRLRDRAIEHLCFIEKPFAIADSAMALAPDGRSLLYAQIDQSGSDIMLMDTGRGRR